MLLEFSIDSVISYRRSNNPLSALQLLVLDDYKF